MPSKEGKTISTTYPNDLTIDNSGFSGVDATTRSIIDGKGNITSTSLSDDVLSVQPQNDDTTRAFNVKNSSGSFILGVDTVDSKVTVGAGQVAANTNYANFGASSGLTLAFSAGNHYALLFAPGSEYVGLGLPVFGNGTDPATTFTTAEAATDRAAEIVPSMWYLHDDITIDAITHLEGADTATGDTTRLHLFSYTFTSGATNCLTSGTLLAHTDDTTNAGSEQPYKSTWTIDSADVVKTKVILCFFECDSANSDYSLNVQIKYHIQ